MALNSWDFDDILLFLTYERGQAGRETVASCKDCRGNLTSNFLQQGDSTFDFCIKKVGASDKGCIQKIAAFYTGYIEKGRCI